MTVLFHLSVTLNVKNRRKCTHTHVRIICNARNQIELQSMYLRTISIDCKVFCPFSNRMQVGVQVMTNQFSTVFYAPSTFTRNLRREVENSSP